MNKIEDKYNSVLLTVLVTANLIATSEMCTTPSGQVGECKIIQNCAPLSFLLPPKSLDDVHLLKQSLCGWSGLDPKVCCPRETTTTTSTTTTTTTTTTTSTEVPSVSTEECYTPHGKLGHCIDITKCDAIVAMVMKPGGVTAEDLTFIESSRCKGPANYSVCCLTQVQSVLPAESGQPGQSGQSIDREQPVQPSQSTGSTATRKATS